jgi:hypothetical protein
VIAQSNDRSALPRPGDLDAGAVSGPARPDSVRVQRLSGRYSRCGDPAALVRRFLPLANRLVRRYHPEPLDDRAQIASIGLANTTERLRRALQHMQTLAAGTDRGDIPGAPRERPKNGRPSLGPSRKSLPQEFISCTASLP